MSTEYCGAVLMSTHYCVLSRRTPSSPPDPRRPVRWHAMKLEDWVEPRLEFGAKVYSVDCIMRLDGREEQSPCLVPT